MSKDPSPPAASGTSTTSDGVSAASSRIATAVRPVPTSATADAKDSDGGTSCRDAAGATAREAYPPPPGPRWATTRRPAENPATSRPGVPGSTGSGGPGCTPARSDASTRCTPQAWTSIGTSSGPGTGSGTSSYRSVDGPPNSYCLIAHTPPTVEPQRRSRSRAERPTATPGDSLGNVSRAG